MNRLAALLVLVACMQLRAQDVRFRPENVDPRTEKAIERGLAFLAKAQRSDGSWHHSSYITTVTSFAGLAFLASGSTPAEGKYADNVNRTVDFIINSSVSDGYLGLSWKHGRSMYGHGYAMLFLSQAYGMERDEVRQNKIRNLLVRGVHLSAKAQSKNGGWYYSPKNDMDEGSVTITQVQGLRSSRNAGISVPKEVIDNAVKYILNSVTKDGGIAYRLGSGGKPSRGGGKPAITAAAIVTLYNAGMYSHPATNGAYQFLERVADKKGGVVDMFGGHFHYSHFYYAQAMWRKGGTDWQKYYISLRDFLVKNQQPDGSWSGSSSGPIFATGIALCILQLPYDNLPIMER